MDTAKVANVIFVHGGDPRGWEGYFGLPRDGDGQGRPQELAPLACIPTTAGTGSEVSFVAVVKDREIGLVPLDGVKWAKPATGPGAGKPILKVSQVLAPGDVIYVDPLEQQGQYRLRQVPEISGGQISHVHHFLDTSLFERFGLPAYLDAAAG